MIFDFGSKNQGISPFLTSVEACYLLRQMQFYLLIIASYRVAGGAKR